MTLVNYKVRMNIVKCNNVQFQDNPEADIHESISDKNTN